MLRGHSASQWPTVKSEGWLQSSAILNYSLVNVARGAKRLQVADVISATVSLALYVVDLFSWRHLALLEASLAQELVAVECSLAGASPGCSVASALSGGLGPGHQVAGTHKRLLDRGNGSVGCTFIDPHISGVSDPSCGRGGPKLPNNPRRARSARSSFLS